MPKHLHQGTTDDPRRLITPLRCIFWGALLCLFDFSLTTTVNGSGFKFDLLNDFVGMILIVAGVFKLGASEVSPGYANAMTFVKVVSVLSMLKSLIDHAVFATPRAWDAFWTFYQLVELAAVLIFCFCMRTLCQARYLDAAARSWQTTAILFIVIYVLPLGAVHCWSLIAMATGGTFTFNLGPAALLFLLIFLIPLIHFFVSTSRMSQEAELAKV
jgi:hypothetical protein